MPLMRPIIRPRVECIKILHVPFIQKHLVRFMRKVDVRLLIYGLNYALELTGIGKYTGEMAERLDWDGQGHTLNLILIRNKC